MENVENLITITPPMDKGRKYRYCQVIPKGMTKVYSYIAKMGVHLDDCVLVPFGFSNKKVVAKVTAVGWYYKYNAPYPVEKTKFIEKIVSIDYYEQYENNLDYDDDWDYEDDLDIVEEYIKEEDYTALFDWACQKQITASYELELVALERAYLACIENDNLRAAIKLGDLYHKGLLADKSKAEKYYQMAAKAGYVQAISNLADFYLEKADYAEAYHYFSLAALLYNDLYCLYKLAGMFSEGLYIKKNKHYACQLYIRALELWDKEHDAQIERIEKCNYSRADICLYLGKAFLQDKVKDSDPINALDFLLQALKEFYLRLETDREALELIQKTKKWIKKAENILQKKSKK